MAGEKDEGMVKEITKRSVDYSQWYIDVVRKAELADYAPVRGCMVIRPYGYALWENVQARLDARIKASGHVNAYFPTLIPESLLLKEAEHVEGFAPEVAWVTQGGSDKLEERLALRPTSEAIICSMYSKWISSYRDLPVLINQWANVFRWEKVTRLFLRTTEFLWQEGHTAHRTAAEAETEALMILKLYEDFYNDDLAIPVVVGTKSESEKFAGAKVTYAIEALMPDGKALQAGTTHDLGQNFAKAFDIKYLDENNTEQYVYQTSWGVSSRVMGAIIMSHGDDNGLIMPPKMAPVQVVIVPITYDATKEAVLGAAAKLREELARFGIRVLLDDRDVFTPGWKFNEHEMRGVPLRYELGPRDLEKLQVMACRRDTREKFALPLAEIGKETSRLLETMQKDLHSRALAFREANTHEATTMARLKEILETVRGFVLAPWCGNPVCEQEVKSQTAATIRCLPHDRMLCEEGPCVVCGKRGNNAVWAKSY
jgi:prolyl-tRNA synthetase